MKQFLSASCKQICLTLLASLFFIVTVGAQGFSPAVQARLQYVIDSFQNNPANPIVGGMSVAINVDGLALWESATGYAARNIDGQNNLLPGGTPFTRDLLSRMYSVTKTFTSPLVLELAREGKIDLDAAVSNFIPLHLINPALNPSVTIRQLLAHESGYSDYTGEFMLQVAVAYQPSRTWTAFETISFTHQIKQPGEERRYSSTNYVMLGAIVEAITKKPIEQHFRERFFDPLQLSSMYFGGRESQVGHGTLVAPHDNISAFNPVFQVTGQPTFPNTFTNISRFPLTAIVSLAFTGGAIVSNVSDMAKWGNALFGGRATSASTIETMMNSISSTPDAQGDYLGYGIWHNNKVSSTDYFVGHNGNAIGYRSVMMYQPDRKMTIAILTNYRGINPYTIAKALYAELPQFLCGNNNPKEDKIMLCYKGNNICVARQAALVHVNKGAYLGSCENHFSLRPEEKLVLTDQLLLKENAGFNIYPNPFSKNATIRFNTLQTGMVALQLFDLNGKMIMNIFEGNVAKETFKQFNLSAENLPAGTYICRLKTATGISQQKLVLNK